MTYAQALPEWRSCDTECRQNALTEICFNMRGKWHEFVHARAAMQSDPPNWNHVYDELLNSLWAVQVKAARANRIANQFLTGEYPS